MPDKRDIAIVKELANRVAEIAALPIQNEKRKLWRDLNGLRSVRPLVMIDQICWNEFRSEDDLLMQCRDADCRRYEWSFRHTLYQWEHFPVDMVVEPFIRVQKAIRNSGFGIGVQEKTVASDPTNAIVSHQYENQLQSDDDLEKIRAPKISHDLKKTDMRLALAHELFDGILEVRPWGFDPYLSLWDPISMWMGVQNACYALIDKPDYIHRLVSRVTDGYMGMLDQLEDQGLLCGPQSLIHCTGAYTDALPAAGYDPKRPRTKDMWMFGLAQMFSTVSPQMFREFEVNYTRRFCDRFGLVYYGCCDPLDGKMNEVRLLPNVRKVSVSPWANEKRAAEEMQKQFVYSRKPNPAFLATDSFNSELVRNDLKATVEICRKYDCPVEFILKDISTVRYQPERLSRWADIAMEVAEG